MQLGGLSLIDRPFGADVHGLDLLHARSARSLSSNLSGAIPSSGDPKPSTSLVCRVVGVAVEVVVADWAVAMAVAVAPAPPPTATSHRVT